MSADTCIYYLALTRADRCDGAGLTAVRLARVAIPLSRREVHERRHSLKGALRLILHKEGQGPRLTFHEPVMPAYVMTVSFAAPRRIAGGVQLRCTIRRDRRECGAHGG